MLADCQEAAISIGTSIEKAEENVPDIISTLMFTVRSYIILA